MEFDGTNPFLNICGSKEKPINFHGHSWYKGQLKYTNLQETTDIFYSYIGFTMSCEKGKESKTVHQVLILHCPVFRAVECLLRPDPPWMIDLEKRMGKTIKEIREKNETNANRKTN